MTTSEIDVYNVVVEQSKITTWIETMYLLKDTGKTHSVQLFVYDSGAVQYDVDQTLIKNGLSEVSVKVRKGVNNRTGEIVGEGISDSTGSINLTLEVGIYTVETTVNGYTSHYCILKVENDKRVEVPIVAQLINNEMKVVLTWEGTTDLDACLFTPYKSDQGNMAYINAVNATDEHGNRFSIDNKNGNSAEVIYIADSTLGDYKYYVSDYSNCIAGNYTATDMNNLNVRVTIYDKNGLLDSYTIPHNRSGVIWEVFEIKNGKVITLQHNYSNLEGKTWWIEDKSIAEKNREARQAYYNMLCIDMPNGIMPEGYEGVGGMALDGSAIEAFTLRDINHDGIEELLIRNGDIVWNKDVNEYLDTSKIWGGCSKTNFVFTYEDSKVKTISNDLNDACCSSLFLMNGNYVYVWSSSLTQHYSDMDDPQVGLKYTVYNNIYDFLEQKFEQAKIVYEIDEVYSEPMIIEYRINNVVVSKNEWAESFQVNVIDQLIPEAEYHQIDEEILRQVILGAELD